MSDRWLRARYGWGAARLRLCPELARCAPPAPTLGAGLAELVAEARALGMAGAARALPLAGVVALGALCAVTLLSTLRRDASDASPLEIVRFEPPAAPEPLVGPPPLPEPVAEVAPPPPPPPTRVAKETPKPEVAPPPQSAAPLVRDVARVEPPVRPPPPVAFEPAPALASPEPAPPPLRPAAKPAPARLASRVAPVLAIDAVAAPRPSLSAPATAIRAERRVAAAASPTARPSFAIDAVPASQAFAPEPREPATASPLPSRSATPRPTGERRSASPPPRLAFAAPALPGRDAAEPPRTATRVALAAPPLAEAATRSGPAQGFDGVPLSSLAACLSDAEEDALKLDVLAARGERRECASAAGRYRFVETRNLNAFLLWVERAPSRREADRCVELRLALECLRGRSLGRNRG
jgi:hypothetical protein